MFLSDKAIIRLHKMTYFVQHLNVTLSTCQKKKKKNTHFVGQDCIFIYLECTVQDALTSCIEMYVCSLQTCQCPHELGIECLACRQAVMSTAFFLSGCQLSEHEQLGMVFIDMPLLQIDSPQQMIYRLKSRYAQTWIWQMNHANVMCLRDWKPMEINFAEVLGCLLLLAAYMNIVLTLHSVYGCYYGTLHQCSIETYTTLQ